LALPLGNEIGGEAREEVEFSFLKLWDLSLSLTLGSVGCTILQKMADASSLCDFLIANFDLFDDASTLSTIAL
jgi:hypothetical protein